MVNTQEQTLKLSRAFGEPEFVAKHRQAAAKILASQSMPTFKYGQGIVVKPRNFKLENLSIDAEIELVKIESQPGVTLRAISPKDSKYLFETVNFSDNYFINLQKAWFNRSAVLEIAPQTRLNKPIEIDLLLSKSSHIDYVLVLVGQGANVEIIEHQKSNQPVFRSSLIEVVVGENAEVQYSLIQSLNLKSTAFDTRRSKVFANGRINWQYVLLGSDFHKLEIGANLVDQGAEAQSNGLIFGSGEQKFNINNSTKHESPLTQSLMNLSGVARDSSNLFAWGSIDIGALAKQSVADEKIDMLVMSEKAQANAIPDLFVATNDVQCGHSASISQLDSDKIFYLQSRGVDQRLATKLLINGFIEPVVKNFKLDERSQTIIHDKVNQIA